ncbi:YbfB/YjiJ family MFS transporter [Neisseriaceae bacterium PsAf]|nr:YbfB/YjiJ family MFS transporter [Neisseriaceae bacterium PsAf]
MKNSLSIRTASSLILAMGIGRFVYTPILPIMQAGTHMSSATAAYIATANYIGYLIGSMLATYYPKISQQNTLRISAMGLVISELAMMATSFASIWFILRLFAGVFSALIFICAAKMLVLYPKKINSGIVYSGVGLGIFISGIMILIAKGYTNWQGLWFLSALLSMPFLILSWSLPLNNKIPQSTQSSTHSSTNVFNLMWTLLLITYFLEGNRYIIEGTFIVATIKDINSNIADYVWILVGLAAAPSTLIWNYFNQKYSTILLIIIAFFSATNFSHDPFILPTGYSIITFFIFIWCHFHGHYHVGHSTVEPMATT